MANKGSTPPQRRTVKKEMRKIVALFFTDPHLWEENIEQVRSICTQIRETAKENNLWEVFCLGDIFQSRKGQSETVLNAFSSILDDFADDKITLNVIPGNHDKMDYDSEKSYLDVYRHHPYFNLITTHATFHPRSHTDIAVTLIPYFREGGDKYGKFLKEVSEMQWAKGTKHILGTHIAVNGVLNNDKSAVESGIELNAFKKFYKVFVGHYHDQSIVGTNIYYIGSALQKNFGEDENKGFTLLYSDGEHEFIQSVFPLYKVITIDSNVNKKVLESLKDDYTNSPDHIRFKFVGEKTKLASIDKNIFKASGIDVKFEPDDVIKTEEQATKTLIQFDNKAISSSFKEFCDEFKFDNPEMGLKYLQEILK